VSDTPKFELIRTGDKPKSKPKQRTKIVGSPAAPPKQDKRPWLLGTDEIPPPIDVPYQMWSKSSNPYEQGMLQFEFVPQGVKVGWWFEPKQTIEWHELALFIGCLPRDFQDDMQCIREQTYTDALREGFAYGTAKAMDFWKEKALQWPQSEEAVKLIQEAIRVLEFYCKVEEARTK